MQRVNDTRQLANRILFWMAVLVTAQFAVAYAMIAAGIVKHSGTYMVGLFICTAVFWIAYVLQRRQIGEGGYSIHLTAFLCLSLITFVGLYNPYRFDEIWVIFLLYPIGISLFHDKSAFVVWGTLSYALYGLLAIFDPSVSEAVDVYNRCFIALASLMLACIAFATLTQLKNSHGQVAEDRTREYVITMLQTLIPIVERKSQSSSKEIEQMSRLMKRVLKEFPQEEIHDWEIKLISILHFVSRIKWPDYVFEKEEKLTDHEYKIVQEHCFIGGDLFKKGPDFDRVVKALQYHHERFDGTGYPYQLKGESIPLVSQILGIVESFMAMTTSRAYREALTPEEAFEEIRAMAGSVYDGRIVEALEKVLRIQTASPNISTGVPPMVG
ncbi:HD-GYP domain-containing protein [Brevibacillus sp. H7]|uniref:HD-GYP domain-containing protein n=1 Tax=Brevibacillus sp. H7 TaxID=3349138 RepID=UPI003804A582